MERKKKSNIEKVKLNKENDVGESLTFKFPRTAHIHDIGGSIGLFKFNIIIFK
jgi:hypothetical protein